MKRLRRNPDKMISLQSFYLLRQGFQMQYKVQPTIRYFKNLKMKIPGTLEHIPSPHLFVYANLEQCQRCALDVTTESHIELIAMIMNLLPHLNGG